MDGTRHRLSRRRLIAAAGAGSTIALVGTAGASAAASAPAASDALPIVANRIASAVTRQADGRAVALAYQPDFHARLEEWLRFWWANSPASWNAPSEIATVGVAGGGRVFGLSAISYTSRGQLTAGFDASARDRGYWSALASMHGHFPVVRAEEGRVWIEDGHPGFVGSAEQVAFVRAALSSVWGLDTTPNGWRDGAERALRRAGGDVDVTTRAGWRAFARSTVRRGLGTQSY